MWNDYWAAGAEFAFFRNLLSSWQLAKFGFQMILWSKKEKEFYVSFSVLRELYLETNFAECREIEGLRLRDSKNYCCGIKKKRKQIKILREEIFLIIGMSNIETEKDVENSDKADVSTTLSFM